ncbi:MAG TPA: hypothetical protein VF047_08850 [Nitrososphaeraceae archaeon]
MSTSLFVNDDHAIIKIPSIYAQDDGSDDGGDDGSDDGGDDGGDNNIAGIFGGDGNGGDV